MDKIEALKTSVKMWAWNSEAIICAREVAFITENGGCLDTNGDFWMHYEPIKEPTYRPYRVGDDISHLLGMKVMEKEDNSIKSLITGIDEDILEVYIRSWVRLDEVFNDYIFLDGTPIGVKE